MEENHAVPRGSLLSSSIRGGWEDGLVPSADTSDTSLRYEGNCPLSQSPGYIFLQVEPGAEDRTEVLQVPGTSWQQTHCPSLSIRTVQLTQFQQTEGTQSYSGP